MMSEEFDLIVEAAKFDMIRTMKGATPSREQLRGFARKAIHANRVRYTNRNAERVIAKLSAYLDMIDEMRAAQ